MTFYYDAKIRPWSQQLESMVESTRRTREKFKSNWYQYPRHHTFIFVPGPNRADTIPITVLFLWRFRNRKKSKIVCTRQHHNRSGACRKHPHMLLFWGDELNDTNDVSFVFLTENYLNWVDDFCWCSVGFLYFFQKRPLEDCAGVLLVMRA